MDEREMMRLQAQTFELLTPAMGFLAPKAVAEYRQAKRDFEQRHELMAEFAAQNGWSCAAVDSSWARRWRGQPFGSELITKGVEKVFGRTVQPIPFDECRNVMVGQWRGRPCVAFDYRHPSADDKAGPLSYSVCALRLPGPTPVLDVRDESTFSRGRRALGISDVQLESEDFNRRFRVTCDDPKLASDVLTPRLMTLLLKQGATSWRMEAGDLLRWESGLHSPDQVVDRLSQLEDILEAIPSFVWTVEDPSR